jgi:hypothetical protein
MDVPISAVILSLIGAIALGKLVVSILVFLAETFLFTGESVRLIQPHALDYGSLIDKSYRTSLFNWCCKSHLL